MVLRAIQAPKRWVIREPALLSFSLSIKQLSSTRTICSARPLFLPVPVWPARVLTDLPCDRRKWSCVQVPLMPTLLCEPLQWGQVGPRGSGWRTR